MELNEKSRRRLERLNADTDIFVTDDGEILRKVGTSISGGVPTVSMVQVRYLVYRRKIGEIPIGKRVVNLDGDVTNNHPDNLGLIDARIQYRPRGLSSLTLAEILKVKRDYNGSNTNQLAIDNNISLPTVEKIIKNDWEGVV